MSEEAREAETVAATASHYYAFAALVGRNGWGASCGESERMREQTRGRRECERQTSACQRVRERESGVAAVGGTRAYSGVD